MIQIKNLTLEFEEKKLFDNANLSLKNGIYLLDGENGCGKTTFLKMLHNNFLIKKSRFFKIEIGHISDNVLIYLDELKIDYTLTEEELTDLVLKNNDTKSIMEHQSIHPYKQLLTYSDGELKMVKLKLLFLLDPDILLLDEPFENLDDMNSKFVFEKIMNRSEKKITIITTHIKEIKPLFENRIIIKNLLFVGIE
jgi:ABC-2 type transport system ATP-binding protein